MSVLLQGIDGVICLLHDILVMGRDQQEHDSHDMTRCAASSARRQCDINNKLEISVPELKYVGHMVSAAVIKPDTRKIAAIIDMVLPTNVAEVRCFLVMMNQLAKFSQRLPELSSPIWELLRKDRTWS